MKGLAPVMLHGLAALGVWFGLQSRAAAGTATLAPVEDATIAEQDPASALGNDILFKSGTTGPMEGAMKNRALLKFDVASSIPANAVITSATLTLTVVQSPPTSAQLWFRLHKVMVPWSEATVSWTSRLASSTESAWSSPGGAASVDYAGEVTQSCLITGLAVFTFGSNPGMVANVQEWLSSPPGNAGWMLLCESEDLEKSVRKFGSREAANPAARPVLTVEYTVPDSAPVLTVLPPVNGEFRFEFNGEAGVAYTVEQSADLDPAKWLELRTFAPLPAAAVLRVSDAMVPGGRWFYRVRTP